MAFERFLVVLKESAPPEATARTLSAMKSLGGRAEMIAGGGKAIIATLDQALAERVRRLPYVKLVGGVRIGRRTLIRKQISKR